jgi:hypothetical protein
MWQGCQGVRSSKRTSGSPLRIREGWNCWQVIKVSPRLAFCAWGRQLTSVHDSRCPGCEGEWAWVVWSRYTSLHLHASDRGTSSWGHVAGAGAGQRWWCRGQLPGVLESVCKFPIWGVNLAPQFFPSFGTFFTILRADSVPSGCFKWVEVLSKTSTCSPSG